jgi:hypothetical protein
MKQPILHLRDELEHLHRTSNLMLLQEFVATEKSVIIQQETVIAYQDN